ncbi:hypothetical protein PsorP6_001199 [Peronosclerospora sorghi]|uniref:Uncharacterized protein n=1 Tax=Peronosclerospora sorghi TaxID=230839 RepID=A0ACC0WVZ4_9STRA|nr:hypothetical protein PsorP6_001199 [Peronosclerospora sorghi]
MMNTKRDTMVESAQRIILQPMHWKRIGTLSDEAPRLYELARSPAARASPDATTTYTLRATKPLDASIAEIEDVLTGQTALLKPHDTSSSSSLLPRLLPATYVYGKTLALYPPLEIASTKERESVRIESARFKSYCLDEYPHREPGERLDTVEDYKILGYTLSTQLQRSNAKKCSKHGTTSVVPSVLHLYRPVCAASAGADRRNDVTWTPPTRSPRNSRYLTKRLPGEHPSLGHGVPEFLRLPENELRQTLEIGTTTIFFQVSITERQPLPRELLHVSKVNRFIVTDRSQFRLNLLSIMHLKKTIAHRFALGRIFSYTSSFNAFHALE